MFLHMNKQSNILLSSGSTVSLMFYFSLSETYMWAFSFGNLGALWDTENDMLTFL